MTAAFLQSELANLISDSRRKHAEVRSAAEKSLNELKSISVTSETQLAGDLIRKTHFVDPFILACKSQNTKLASNGAACLQRLVASTAIPRSRLLDLLQAFEDAVPLALEVQLKILQTLPSLLQLYAADLHGEALSRTLSVSADLSSNKLPMVSSTASATFQQLLTAVFTKATEASSQRSQKGRDSQSAQDSEDAIAVFADLCSLLKGEQLDFVRLEKLQPSLILETVETLLSTYGTFVLAENDALKACARSLVPGLSNLIEISASYPVVVRAYRIAFILTTQYLLQVTDPIATLLKVILKAADRGGAHKWKRVLSLEFCRGFCSDFDALRRSFGALDMAEEKFSFVSDLMASLVRIASEDPSLIGLGRQSTIPTSTPADSNGDLTRTVETPVTVGNIAQAETSSIGISAQHSSMQTPCLDQYDRATPADFPETYIFTLVLGCISAFSDGLSKYIMPLSVPSRKSNSIIAEEQEDTDDSQPQRKASLRNTATLQKYQQLLNPLTRKDIGRLSSIEECAKMIESCWPAVLATCSTFLNAALDSYFYHMLIRTVQKLTQVSGVLELNTPRDALLTTLAKVSVPANVSSLMNTFYGSKPAYQSDLEVLQNGEEASVRSPVSSTPRQSIDVSTQTLNVRNLLCLRALLNLGIALGPTMSASAWTILWQSLEQVEALMSVNPTTRFAQSGGAAVAGDTSSSTTLAGEISAVDTARKRMIESTTTYSDASFGVVCKSLFQMIEDVIPSEARRNENDHSSSETLRPKTLTHKSTRSVSGSWAKVTTLEVEVQFVLKFVGRLASVNLRRFKEDKSSGVSWHSIVSTLSLLQSNRKLQPHLRLQSANIIDAIVVESCTISDEGDDENDNDPIRVVERFSIPALHRQIQNVQYFSSNLQRSSDVETQTALLMLEALHNVVSSCGEDLDQGWKEVFTILNAVISHRVLNTGKATQEMSHSEGVNKIFSAAFKVAHLTAADFLSNLQDEHVAELLSLFTVFGSQRTDLNMSLTTIALYWNVAGLINDRSELIESFNEAAEPDKAGIAGSRVHGSSNLWQATLLGLQSHCKDNRSDSRNAAVRMLAKVVEASMPQMSSATLNSYWKVISLPLLDFYSQREADSENDWEDTALQVFHELVANSQAYGAVLMQDGSFHGTCLHLISSSKKLFRAGELVTITTVYHALSDIVSALCQADTSGAFVMDEGLLEASWEMWLLHDPTKLKLDSQTQDAFASYARFLLAMAKWNLKALSNFQGANSLIGGVVDRLLYDSIHETYTVDTNKVSPEQEQVLKIIDVLRDLSAEDPGTFVLHLLLIARNLVQRTANAHVTGQPVKSAKGVRQPTGIAFTTACIEKLRFLMRSQSASTVLPADYPFSAVLETCTDLIKTKYSSMPINSQDPLWQKATSLAVECIMTVDAYRTKSQQPYEVEELLPTINTVLAAILEVPHLENRSPEARPATEIVLTDEKFDVDQLNAMHAAVHNILLTSTEMPPFSQKQYALILFHHSLVAKPWYNDLPTNLNDEPLENLTKIRLGSIRAPDLSLRQNIYPEALKCLFSLVASSTPTTASSNANKTNTTLPALAAPYILLRLAQTLKTFLADQPLRYLQHPHAALQRELHVVLRAFVDLRVSDDAFTSIVQDLGLHPTTIRHDGKTHLRIMTGLITKFEKLWVDLPRLRKGLAWQDCEDGVGVERCLEEWRLALTQGTTVYFS